MKIGHLFALSRTPHALLDLAAPALAGLVWLNHFPHASVVLIGLLTTFAAYTAVYALNDLVDYHEDRKRIELGCDDYGDYIDAVYSRHPIAQGCLRLRTALLWTGGWAIIAGIGSYLLNPTCLFIFLGALLAEVIYCRLSRITPLRALLAGFVKTAGPVAAVFAVDQNPAPERLLLLFGWLFLWEIGGQNIPSDWTDIDEDRRLEVRTLPVRLQSGTASRLVLIILVCAVGSSLLITKWVTLIGSLLYLGVAILTGVFLLLLPATRLLLGNMRGAALSLFNRASYYPLSLLAVVTIKAALRI